MIRFENFTKKFGDFKAVDNLNLEVHPGEIFAFLGPNGAGKTTTVKVVTGLIRPTSGRVIVGGYDVVSQTIEAKKLMGLVPEQPFVYPKLTGVEFMRFVGDLYGVSRETARKRIPELLEMFELKEWGGDLLECYSHGMRQKIVVASALLHEPKVLVMDEPLVGLDPKSARLVKNVFKELASRGVTLFMCTHILEIAEKISHRIGIIFHGKLIALGSLDDLRRRAVSRGAGDNLEDVFLALTAAPSEPVSL